MVKIRLTKLGRHKLPAYRIVAMDSRKRRDGAYLHLLGTYEPATGKTKLNEELILKVLAQGAQPSDTILSILKDNGIWAKFLATKKKPAKKAKRKLSKKKVAKKVAKKNAPKKAKVAPAAKPAEKKPEAPKAAEPAKAEAPKEAK